MEKGLLAIFNILAIILIFYVMSKCIKKDNKYKIHYLVLLCTALLSNFIYCFYLLFNNLTIMRVALNINFMIEGWILYSFLAFVNFYTEKQRNKIVSVLLFILVLIDNSLFIVNIFNPIMADYNVLIIDSTNYLKIDTTPLFLYHLFLDYSMFLCSALLLIFKAKEVPHFYKARYICILVSTSVSLIINGILFIFSFPIDFSIIFYGLISLIIYFFGINFSPILLKHNIEDLVVNEMEDYLIVFDYELRFFSANNGALEVFSNSIKDKTFDEFLNKYPLLKFNSSHPVKISVNDNDYYFEVIRKSFIDKHNKLQAEMILLHDVSIGVNEKILREYQRTHDPLTDIFNRNYFIEASTKKISKEADTYYVIATDYSGFRLVNDFFGSQKGNQILIDTGSTLKNLYYNTDIIFARMEADKFALLVKKSNIDDGIIDIIYNELNNNIKMLPLSLRLGICIVNDNNVLDAYDKCIMTVHYIKDTFDKKYAYYDNHVGENEIRAHLLLSSLDESINNKYFELYYQPQINSYDNTLVGAEALIRWNHPTLGRISPGEFIPLFEKNMVITRLDLYVWEEACKFLKRCQNTKLAKLSISINISPKDFYLIDVSDEIIKLVDKYNIDPRLLKLEITESAFVSDQNKLIGTIRSLQEKGFIIEMDDFGSGYSSFNSLKDIPIDVLKLDMKFLNGNIKNNKTEEILTSIIGMAHRIHMPIIAEGVETIEQLNLLHEFNCDIIQGYYYAKPMSEVDFLNYLNNMKITSFIDFWTSCDENKEIFSTFKEIQACFNQSPVSTLILGPKYNNTKDKILDMIVYYCNPSFLKNEGFITNDISLKSIKNIYKEYDDSLGNIFYDILKNNNEHKEIIIRNGKHVHVYSYSIKKRYIAIIITYLED